MPILLWKRSFLGAGIAYASGAVLHPIGLSLLPAAYYVSLKRFSIVFDVILGRLIHNEDYFRQRLTGAFFMAAGVILIAFG